MRPPIVQAAIYYLNVRWIKMSIEIKNIKTVKTFFTVLDELL